MQATKRVLATTPSKDNKPEERIASTVSSSSTAGLTAAMQSTPLPSSSKNHELEEEELQQQDATLTKLAFLIMAYPEVQTQIKALIEMLNRYPALAMNVTAAFLTQKCVTLLEEKTASDALEVITSLISHLESHSEKPKIGSFYTAAINIQQTMQTAMAMLEQERPDFYSLASSIFNEISAKTEVEN